MRRAHVYAKKGRCVRRKLKNTTSIFTEIDKQRKKREIIYSRYRLPTDLAHEYFHSTRISTSDRANQTKYMKKSRREIRRIIKTVLEKGVECRENDEDKKEAVCSNNFHYKFNAFLFSFSS